MANNSSEERISQKLSSNSAEKKSNNTTGIIIISCVVVAIVITLVLVLSGKSKDDKKSIVTPNNVDEIVSDFQEDKVEQGMYEVTMNTHWEFANGESASSNAYVENSTANTNDVYFDIVRSDTGETIYSSPIIPIGSHLENITLDTDLEAGDYSCVLTYHLLDENEEPVSKLNINLDISVKN